MESDDESTKMLESSFQ
ncbi:unnamed protein product, partial [Rotaria sordida]